MEAANVRAVRYTATGACGVGRARITGVIVTVGAGAGRLTISEGATTRLDLDFTQNTTQDVMIPGDGILCSSDPSISTLTNISAITIFFV